MLACSRVPELRKNSTVQQVEQQHYGCGASLFWVFVGLVLGKAVRACCAHCLAGASDF